MADKGPGRLRAEFIYGLYGLLLRGDCLGYQFETEIDGAMVELAFPKKGLDENPSVVLPSRPFVDFETTFDFPAQRMARPVVVSPAPGSTIAVVDRARISITRDWLEFDGRKAQDILASLEPVADAAMVQVFDLFRTRLGQPWLGLTGTKHEAIAQRLVDLRGDTDVPTLTFTAGPIRIFPHTSALNAAALQAAFADSQVALGEGLLADAAYFLWEHFPQGAPVAVLLAAVSCEVEVKVVIRETAGDRLALAEALISNPRDFSVAARELFSKVMKAVNGRSLRDENRSLEKQVGELFETRNAIAHRGEVSSPDKARDCVVAAGEVHAWLADVRASCSSGR